MENRSRNDPLHLASMVFSNLLSLEINLKQFIIREGNGIRSFLVQQVHASFLDFCVLVTENNAVVFWRVHVRLSALGNFRAYTHVLNLPKQ